MINDPDIVKKQFLNENTYLSSKSNDLPNIINNLQCKDLKQLPMSTTTLLLESNIVKPVKDTNCQSLPTDEVKVSLNNEQPSCSNHINNIFSSVGIKTESNISYNKLSQGTYRSEEDSVIVIYSSDEENNINENSCELHNIKLENEQIDLNSISTENAYPSTSKEENNLNLKEWANQCYEILSDDDDDDVICITPKINSKDDNLMSLTDYDNDISKFPQIIEPLPLKSNTKRSTVLNENENIMKTRAKSAKNSINKKKAEEMTINQNKQIIETRRVKLQQLAKNFFTSSSTEINTSIINQLTTDDSIDKHSTIDILNKKPRISRLQKNDYNNCIPSTSRAHLITEPKNNIKKTVTINSLEVPTKKDEQIVNNLPSNSNNISFTTACTINHVDVSFFDTLSKICKWNAVWLYVS